MPDEVTTRENVASLEAFFDVIYDYAKENYIESISDEFGEHFEINYNEKAYNVGYMTSSEIFFYCNRVAPTEKGINFNNILSNKKELKTDLIDMKLKTLRLILSEIKDEVPESFIEKEVAKVYSHKKM